MEWNQDQIGTAIAASVPIVASAVGILTALVSLTKEARLKRRAEMLRAEIAAASEPHDAAILQSLHRFTTARIVALMSVPASRMLGQVLMTLFWLLMPLAAGFLGYVAWGMVFNGVFDRGTGAQRGWFFAFAAGSALALYYSFWLRLFIVEILKSLLERRRMEALYLDGQDLDQSMSRSTGLPPVESLEPLSDGAKNTAGRIHRRLRVTVWTATAGFGLLAFCYGVMLAGVVLEMEINTLVFNYVAPIGLIVGLLDLLIAPGIIVTGFNQTPDEWAHPRPVSTAAQVQAEIETAQPAGSPSSCRGLRRLFRRGR